MNGVLDESASQVRIGKDCKTVIFERAIHSRLFTKYTLAAIMQHDQGKRYQEDDNRAIAYDNCTTQEMRKKGVVPDINGFYWGQEQTRRVLKDKSTGDLDTNMYPYYNGNKIGTHRQYNTIIVCK